MYGSIADYPCQGWPTIAFSGPWRRWYKQPVGYSGTLEMSVMEPLLSEAEAAKLLGGLHPKTVQRMARAGTLPAYRIGRYWRFRASELDEWLRVQSRCQYPPAQ